ncbi:hypothetical protein F2P81_009253 [Scophthalmus maximus]|uniref:Uncharacterized protein n=1 Tax=Scophthalmus maximus TaxID=52904 RepID=A0A6A4T197_SCOMX|nr:hypothetical protein F2P81_009253 [Scophthalmus maximus]
MDLSTDLMCRTEKLNGTLASTADHQNRRTGEISTELMHICHLDRTRPLQQTAAKVERHAGPPFTMLSFML